MAKAMICDVCKKVVNRCESLKTKIIIETGYHIVDNRLEFFEWDLCLDLCSDCTDKLKEWLRAQKEDKEDGNST